MRETFAPTAGGGDRLELVILHCRLEHLRMNQSPSPPQGRESRRLVLKLIPEHFYHCAVNLDLIGGRIFVLSARIALKNIYHANNFVWVFCWFFEENFFLGFLFFAILYHLLYLYHSFIWGRKLLNSFFKYNYFRLLY